MERNRIILYHTNSGNTPNAENINVGEIAISTLEGEEKIFIKNADGTVAEHYLGPVTNYHEGLMTKAQKATLDKISGLTEELESISCNFSSDVELNMGDEEVVRVVKEAYGIGSGNTYTYEDTDIMLSDIQGYDMTADKGCIFFGNTKIKNVYGIGPLINSCHFFYTTPETTLHNYNGNIVTFMWSGCTNLESIDVTDWNILKAYEDGKIDKSYALAYINGNKDVNIIGLLGLFQDLANDGTISRVCTNSSAISNYSDLANLDLSKCSAIYFPFSFTNINDFSFIENWNMSNIRVCNGILMGSTGLTSLSCVSNWDMSHCTTFNYGFQNCINLTDASAIGNWNMSKAVSLLGLFQNDYQLETIVLPAMPSAITNTSSMFGGCSSLANVTFNGILSTSLSFSHSPLTRDSALNIFNHLDSVHAGTLSLSSSTKALLSDEDIAIATSKGWTIA